MFPFLGGPLTEDNRSGPAGSLWSLPMLKAAHTRPVEGSGRHAPLYADIHLGHPRFAPARGPNSGVEVSRIPSAMQLVARDCYWPMLGCRGELWGPATARGRWCVALRPGTGLVVDPYHSRNCPIVQPQSCRRRPLARRFCNSAGEILHRQVRLTPGRDTASCNTSGAAFRSVAC